VHYVIVRRDLPFGVILAQLTHAAGESFYKLAGVAQKKERQVSNLEVAGSSPAPGSIQARSSEKERGASEQDDPAVAGSIPAGPANLPTIEHTTAVVLGVRDEARLLRLERRLARAGVAHVAVREPDAPWCGQLMAIGLVPGDRDELRPHVREFQTFKERGDSDAGS
jgi:hypothetical protein